MISERELRQIAGRKALPIGQTEHEYVMLCALDALGRTPPLAETFCLKGGTALRLLYFADWRHSVDLDFSVLPSFSGDDLEALLRMWFEQATLLHGVEMAVRDFHRVNGAARVRSRFVGPLRHPNRLLLDITLDEPVLLTPPRRPAIGSVFDNLQPPVLCYALEEIMAEKLRSILQRGKARDYYDVWRLLREKADAFDHATARRVLTQKCTHKGLLNPILADFLRPDFLQDAAAYWVQELADQIPGGELPPWTAMQEEIEQLLGRFLA
jgi:predicted nucleotidyltransferase component of viral defense system